MLIGYARVSTIGQTLEQQTEALEAAGAGRVFHDVMSGVRDDRPGFAECLQYLRDGDTLVVWRLDRLGRNMRGIVNTLHELTERGVTVRSLHDGVDTSTSTTSAAKNASATRTLRLMLCVSDHHRRDQTGSAEGWEIFIRFLQKFTNRTITRSLQEWYR